MLDSVSYQLCIFQLYYLEPGKLPDVGLWTQWIELWTQTLFITWPLSPPIPIASQHQLRLCPIFLELFGYPSFFGGVFLFPQCTIAWMNYPFVEPSGPRPPNFSSPPQLTYPTTHLFQPETLVPASTPLFPKPQYLINHQGFCFVFVYLFVF